MASKTISVEIRGTKRLAKLLDKYGDEALQATKQALFMEGEGIMAQAKELVPVDTGNLRASGHVRLPEARQSAVSVQLGFGGPAGAGTNAEDVGYAVIVHEDLNAFHEVGTAKYLEMPVSQAKRGLSKRIADHVARKAGVAVKRG